jgi:hypothetical protein
MSGPTRLLTDYKLGDLPLISHGMSNLSVKTPKSAIDLSVYRYRKAQDKLRPSPVGPLTRGFSRGGS